MCCDERQCTEQYNQPSFYGIKGLESTVKQFYRCLTKKKLYITHHFIRKSKKSSEKLLDSEKNTVKNKHRLFLKDKKISLQACCDCFMLLGIGE